MDFFIVVIDYFTKWIEAHELARIKEENIERFILDDVSYWFGVPKILLTDNGKQVNNAAFKWFSEKYHIEFHNTSIAYPQLNGQCETRCFSFSVEAAQRFKGMAVACSKVEEAKCLHGEPHKITGQLEVEKKMARSEEVCANDVELITGELEQEVAKQVNANNNLIKENDAL
ncbi:uncharacterized protein LOC122063400 [Macadamia integrifolia]|uniref:uncharacterized protein LOC122063400 n=1 Tax=Macadamia integrifolia TaxID=60698 RepID=UPI001C4E99ED|nr:uncharacterized protein LOC122063400 [Macadamia integrifolia]